MLYKKIHRQFLRQFRRGKTLIHYDVGSYHRYGAIIFQPYLEVDREDKEHLIIIHTETRSIALIIDGRIREEFHAI